MALQMDEAPAFDRRQLRLLDGIQLTASGPQFGEIVAARANMDADTLVPIGAIDAMPLGFGHRETLCSNGDQESRCRATAGGGGFPSKMWRAARSWAFSARLRGSMRL